MNRYLLIFTPDPIPVPQVGNEILLDGVVADQIEIELGYPSHLELKLDAHREIRQGRLIVKRQPDQRRITIPTAFEILQAKLS